MLGKGRNREVLSMGSSIGPAHGHNDSQVLVLLGTMKKESNKIQYPNAEKHAMDNHAPFPRFTF